MINRADLTNGRVWHPWLRVSRLIITIRTTHWDAATWPTAKATLLNAVKERSRAEPVNKNETVGS